MLKSDTANIKLSKTQLSKMIQSGRFIANLLVDPALRVLQRDATILAKNTTEHFVNKGIH